MENLAQAVGLCMCVCVCVRERERERKRKRERDKDGEGREGGRGERSTERGIERGGGDNSRGKVVQ